MSPNDTKEWVGTIGGIIAAATAIVATFKAIAEWRRAIAQRKDELSLRKREFRQKQAIFGRELVREIFADVRARAAFSMLEWPTAEYKDGDKAFVIHSCQIQQSLHADEGAFSPEEAFIRTRFDALYNYLEQVENLIALEILDFEDLKTTFRYYMEQAQRDDIQHLIYLDHYDFPKAKQFLLRFPAKRQPAEPK